MGRETVNRSGMYQDARRLANLLSQAVSSIAERWAQRIPFSEISGCSFDQFLELTELFPGFQRQNHLVVVIFTVSDGRGTSGANRKLA